MDLPFVIECNMGRGWGAIASFDCEPPARAYMEACCTLRHDYRLKLVEVNGSRILSERKR